MLSATRRQRVYNNHTFLATIENYEASITAEVSENGEFICPVCCNNLKGYKSFVNHVTHQHPALARPQPLESKRSIERFSFDEGCSSVLQGSNDNKKQKYGGLAKYHDFVPAKLLIKQPASNMARNTMYLLLFINGPSRNTLNSSVTSNANFEAQLVFSSTDPCNNTATITASNKASNNLSSLYSQVQNGRYSKAFSIFGPFVKLNRDLEEALGCSFSHRKHLLSLIPALFVGGVIQAKNFVLMITSCELYARDANIDEHLESNRGVFPYMFEAESRRYKGITIKVI